MKLIDNNDLIFCKRKKDLPRLKSGGTSPLFFGIE
jgi:hypothetical protein